MLDNTETIILTPELKVDFSDNAEAQNELLFLMSLIWSEDMAFLSFFYIISNLVSARLWQGVSFQSLDRI